MHCGEKSAQYTVRDLLASLLVVAGLQSMTAVDRRCLVSSWRITPNYVNGLLRLRVQSSILSVNVSVD
jgi:hypothetical protein